MHTTEQLNSALAGRYTIERRVGEGGMATVYLARDVKHNRRVALKVLKPDLGAIVGVERFLSEIEVTANLQHPNLLPLFDSGAADGLLFYVMPYVEGESLRARLDREKQLPIDEAVRIATAVAGALDYAHRQGVIHRDLKPENILLHDGQPLVADFGIALALSNAGGNRVTQTGLSLGTPQYMSPEQATGDRAIDARTDIYSLGALTYEMLTGDPPHTGSSSQAIIARLLTERPRSVRASRANVPAHVEAAVEQALEKLAADRFATAKEFAEALSGARTVTRLDRPGTVVGVARPGRERVLAGALGVTALLALALGVYVVRGRTAPVDAAEVRFEVATSNSSSPLQISVSPDGRTLLYTAMSDRGQSLWIRPLASLKAMQIATIEGANGLAFWSPDSRQVAFVSGDKLHRVAIGGGGTETICALPTSVRGGSWNAQGVIIYSGDGVIYRVPGAGGVPVKISLSAPGVVRWDQPFFLPDGDRFLVIGRQAVDSARSIYVATLDGGSPIRVASSATAKFAPPNQLLFVREGTLYAQSLDLGGLRLEGEPVRIVDNVGVNPATGNAGFSASTTGTLVVRAPGTIGKHLRWYSRAGAPQGVIGDTAQIDEIAVSPDGRRIAETRSSSRGFSDGIWTVEIATNIASPLLTRAIGASGVLWSPDSRSLTYRSGDTLWARPIGGSTDSLVHVGAGRTRAEDYTRDGKTLLMRQAVSGTILAATVGGTGTPKELVTQRGVDEMRISPDGRIVTWNTTVSGSEQVWAASFPTFENRRQVSANGGVQARWRADGKELLFLSLDGKVMSAAVVPGQTPEFRAPMVLFQSPLTRPSGVSDDWDITADGQRFLFAVSLNREAETPPLTVLLNWTNALRGARAGSP